MTSRMTALTVLAILLSAQAAWSQWSVVGDGIEYRSYTVSGPNNVFVTRLDRANTNATLESTIAMGKLYTGKETVRSQASRYDDAINFWGQIWGQRNDVVVAVNGDFYNTTTGVPTGGQIQSGWYCKRFGEFGGWSAMAWTLNRGLFMGGCVNHPADRQLVKYNATGVTQQLTGINTDRGTSDLIIYTPHYDNNTHTDNTGVEVLVEMETPLLIKPRPAQALGTIRQIRQNQGSSLIPFDHIVLSATGSKATTLLANATVGAQIGVSMEITDYLPGCSTRTSNDWTKTYACVGGNFIYLADGVPQPTDNPGLTARNPRTAVAYNSTYIYFIVVDGRSTSSVGMSMTELADFSLNYLSATWGYNQDGGGSSTMVVNGVVKNDPSDGSERAVANGIMMINVAPRQQSTAFAAGNAVKTTTTTGVRLGPGTNYESIATLGNNAQGVILTHALQGLYAKGQYWWKCDFSGTVGWVTEGALALDTSGQAPVITQHPSSVAVGAGDTAVFAIQATGTEPLSYQWQRNQANLSNTGPYSGVLTNTLTISPVSTAEVGAYRCVVTNEAGEAASNEATLKVVDPDFDGDLDVDLLDFAHLQLCLGTPTYATVPGCTDADLDGDEVVSFLDVVRFMNCQSGPEVPMTAGCLTQP